MFYEPDKNDHGLPHNPFKSCCIPRPIGWISTLSPEGKPNLAPFSQFQNLTFDPPYVMISANQKTTGARKDSVANAEATGEFVWNMATYAQREAVNISAMEVEPGTDEFELAKLEKLPSKLPEYGTHVVRANLREQVAWSHPAGDEDTQAKADDHVRMAITQAMKSEAPETHERGEYSRRCREQPRAPGFVDRPAV